MHYNIILNDTSDFEKALQIVHLKVTNASKEDQLE